MLHAYLGIKVSGYVIDKYYTSGEGNKDWHSIWISFAVYALVVAVLFWILFRYKHHPSKAEIRKGEAIEMTPH